MTIYQTDRTGFAGYLFNLPIRKLHQ